MMLGSAIVAAAVLLSGCQAADPLEGTSWQLLAYGESLPIAGTTITARFQEGQIRGSGGCNSYWATYRLAGSRIEIDELAWTVMACIDPAGVNEQESLVMRLLHEAQTYRVVDGQLQILPADGQALTFVPAH